MKWNILVGTLVLGLGLSTQSFGGDLLDRMLGNNYSGCSDKVSCCDTPCADPGPSCGCETGCDVQCVPCKPKCRKTPLLDLLRGCTKCKKSACDGGCDATCADPGCADPACGCEQAADPGCGCEQGCDKGCDSCVRFQEVPQDPVAGPAPPASAAKRTLVMAVVRIPLVVPSRLVDASRLAIPGCGAEPACGCENGCDTCATKCVVKKRCRVSLLDRIFGCRKCKSSCSEPACGCEQAAKPLAVARRLPIRVVVAKPLVAAKPAGCSRYRGCPRCRTHRGSSREGRRRWTGSRSRSLRVPSDPAPICPNQLGPLSWPVRRR